jgi:transposase
MLLTTLIVETTGQARNILRYYKKRWICEQAGQFLKSRIGLERFRVRRYVAIQRLTTLAMLAMGFLTWILLRSGDLTKRLFSLTSRFRKDVIFKYYRLLDGIQQFARLNPNECLMPPPDAGRSG